MFTWPGDDCPKVVPKKLSLIAKRSASASWSPSNQDKVASGKMTCSDCHNPHSGDAIAEGSTNMAAVNESCLKCHTSQGGPYVFEHEASREGCTVCHNAHGSPNAKMLKARNANLCLQCHFQQNTSSGQIMIGGLDGAIDVVLPDPIPGKGMVLTAISNFWFKRLEHVIPNHLTGVDPAEVLTDPRDRAVAGVGQVLVLFIYLWDMLIKGHIYSRALNISRLQGNLLSLALSYGIFAISALLIPLPT